MNLVPGRHACASAVQTRVSSRCNIIERCRLQLEVQQKQPLGPLQSSLRSLVTRASWPQSQSRDGCSLKTWRSLLGAAKTESEAATAASDPLESPSTGSAAPRHLAMALATYPATCLHALREHAPQLMDREVLTVHWAGASVGEADALPLTEAFLLHHLPSCKARSPFGTCDDSRGASRSGVQCASGSHACSSFRSASKCAVIVRMSTAFGPHELSSAVLHDGLELCCLSTVLECELARAGAAPVPRGAGHASMQASAATSVQAASCKAAQKRRRAR